MFTVPSVCGRCNELVDFDFVWVADHTQRSPQEVEEMRRTQGHHVSRGQEITTKKDGVHGSAVSHCPRCNGPSLILFTCPRYTFDAIQEVVKGRQGSILGGHTMISVREILPPPKKPDADPAWPEEILVLFSDAQRALAQGFSASMVIGACRTVLDVSTKKLAVEPTEGILAKRIKTLRERNVITQPIADWAHTIRVLGNDAVHDAQGTHEEAAELVDFIRIFLNVAFALPKRIEEKKLH